MDFTVDNNNSNGFSENTANECAVTQPPWTETQLQYVRGEQHSKYMNQQNKKVISLETKNRLLITDVNLTIKNT